jgi:hypothetical protein
MKISEAFPSKFVQASDLNGREVRLTIASLTFEKMSDQSEKLCIYFRGTDKGLVLNKTNASTIADMHGDDTDLWVGKQITIFPTKVDFQGKRVDAIRVKFIQQPAALGGGMPGAQFQQSAQPVSRTAVNQFNQPQDTLTQMREGRIPAADDPFPGDVPFNDEVPF